MTLHHEEQALTQLPASSFPWPVIGPDSPATDVIAAILRAIAVMLARPPAAGGQAAPAPPAMLTVAQTAALLRVSRMTVIRKADCGELPCLIVNREPRQKLRRFLRALIEDLVAGGVFGPAAELKDCTAQWLAEIAARRADARTEVQQGRPEAGAARRRAWGASQQPGCAPNVAQTPRLIVGGHRLMSIITRTTVRLQWSGGRPGTTAVRAVLASTRHRGGGHRSRALSWLTLGSIELR